MWLAVLMIVHLVPHFGTGWEILSTTLDHVTNPILEGVNVDAKVDYIMYFKSSKIVSLNGIHTPCQILLPNQFFQVLLKLDVDETWVTCRWYSENDNANAVCRQQSLSKDQEVINMFMLYLFLNLLYYFLSPNKLNRNL